MTTAPSSSSLEVLTLALVRVRTVDGAEVCFEDRVIGSGGMKDVFLSQDRTQVVAFFRQRQDAAARDRLAMICGTYREKIFSQPGGEYWKNLFCWPTAVIESNGRLGLVAPVYQPHFYFKFGSVDNDSLGLRGKEKEGKWFASALHQNKYLDSRERGSWLSYLRVCLLTARAVRRLHAAGLAHSDLSYKNVLVDPSGGNVSIIDVDGLVVPGKFPPDVVGTPDFIAPEVMATRELPRDDPRKALPRIQTDRHALSVLIYMYLLYRHPLRGRLVHDVDDAQNDEALAMGERALFIEHPTDTRNRYDGRWLKANYGKRLPHFLPWLDLDQVPNRIVGPYLKELFTKAFIEGLHKPELRPTADDWEQAIVKTVDLVQPCLNAGCVQKWFVFDNATRPVCPFCHTPFRGVLPVLNLYSKRSANLFKPDNHRLMVYHNQYLYQWHSDRRTFPNEKLTEEQRKPVGYFVFQKEAWYFVNQRLPGMREVATGKAVPANSMIRLEDGQQLLLSPDEGGRLAQVQLVRS